MRRQASSIVVAAVALLALSACGAPAEVASTPEGSTTPSPADATPQGDGSTPVVSGDCTSPYSFGADEISDKLTVEGDGPDTKLSLPEGTEFTTLQRVVLEEGNGDVLNVGDYANIEFVISDAVTGEVLSSSKTGSQDFVTGPIDDTNGLIIAPLVCAPLGTATAFAVPAEMAGAGTPLLVFAQASDKLEMVANGEAVADVDPNAPSVTLDSEGFPIVGIPDGEPPATTTVTVLKKGAGPVVADGDEVIFQYHLMTWEDKAVQQTTYQDFKPLTAKTSGLIPGFTKALVGQTIGSQVVVVVKPEDGYTTPGNEGDALYGHTLVFVIDILAANPPFVASE